MPSSSVGLFFVVDGELLLERIALTTAHPYGEFRILDASHDDVWQQHHVRRYRVPYDHHPRGRIVYHEPTRSFIAYMDRCIDETMCARILAEFGLRGGETRIDRTDAHYVCHRCRRWTPV